MSLNLLLKQAVDYHRAGNLSRADEIYAFICEASPNSAQVYYLRGLVATDTGASDKAVEFLNRAASLGLQHVDLYFQLARAYTLAGKPETALENYRRVLGIDPGNIDALCNAANILWQLGQQQEALASYETALKLAPGNATIHYNLGTLYLQRLQPERARPCFEAAVELRPDYANAWNSLGVAFNEMGELDLALQAFKKTTELDAAFPEPWFNMHGIYLDTDEIPEALRCLSAASELAPENLSYRFFLGALHYCRGDKVEGERIIESLRNRDEVKAEIDSLDYLAQVSANLPPMIGSGIKIITLAMENARQEGLVLEFGVFNGKSIRLIASLTEGAVHGFDSFEGLPESWCDEDKGTYSAFGQLLQVPGNVSLHRGWFEDSIPEFNKTEKGPIRFINIDCDLYSSTKTIFDLLGGQIVPGSVILFDEFIGYPSWKDDEYKAFHEAAEQYGWQYEILGFSFLTKQVAVVIK